MLREKETVRLHQLIDMVIVLALEAKLQATIQTNTDLDYIASKIDADYRAAKDKLNAYIESITKKG